MSSKRKACVYCGRQTEIKTEKCSSCGSSSFESLKESALHQEQHQQFNKQPNNTSTSKSTTSTSTKQSHKNNKTIITAASALGFIAVIIIVIVNVVISVNKYANSNNPNNEDIPNVHTYSINSDIDTDWFTMTVYEGKIIRVNSSYCGLEPPETGYERILVDINLENYLSKENLDINIAEDFYLETSAMKFNAKNTGGSYSIFDKLSTDGMFFGKFMVSPNHELHGYIAFDVPANVVNLKFVYREFLYENDVRTTTIKKYYVVDLEYETPQIPNTTAQAFYDRALASGYVLEVINDYDGYGTFWIGAHKYVDESTKGIVKKPEPIYWVDFTMDISEHNAKVEYNNFVKKVKQIDGTPDSHSGVLFSKNYQWETNESSTQFGFAYQIGLYNYLVEKSPIEYKTEIISFINLLGINFRKGL